MWSLLSCVKDVVKSSLILTTCLRTLRLIMSLGIFLIPLTYRATILYTTTWHHLKPARFATNSFTAMTHLCPTISLLMKISSHVTDELNMNSLYQVDGAFSLSPSSSTPDRTQSSSASSSLPDTNDSLAHSSWFSLPSPEKIPVNESNQIPLFTGLQPPKVPPGLRGNFSVIICKDNR